MRKPATALFVEFDDFDDIITDDSDDYRYLSQASDNRVRFSPFAQEAKYGFPLQARPKLIEDDITEFVIRVKTWFRQSLVRPSCFYGHCRILNPIVTIPSRTLHL